MQHLLAKEVIVEFVSTQGDFISPYFSGPKMMGHID